MIWRKIYIMSYGDVRRTAADIFIFVKKSFKDLSISMCLMFTVYSLFLIQNGDCSLLVWRTIN